MTLLIGLGHNERRRLGFQFGGISWRLFSAVALDVAGNVLLEASAYHSADGETPSGSTMSINAGMAEQCPSALMREYEDLARPADSRPGMVSYMV